MVWAPIWYSKPSRRPSRRHPQKNLIFSTYFLLIFPCFGDPLEHPKSQKNVVMHECGGPILAPKAAWEENGAPGCHFKAFCLPKLVFWQQFSSIFCIFLGSRSGNSIKHRLPNNALTNRLCNHAIVTKYVSQSCTFQICIPIMHCQIYIPNGTCQICVPTMHLPIMHPNRALAKYASQSCTCQICIPNVHLPNMHPDHALAKYASQTCTDQICVPSMHLPNMHPSTAAQQVCQELDKKLSETCHNNDSCSGSATTRGAAVLPPGGLRLNKIQ